MKKLAVMMMIIVVTMSAVACGATEKESQTAEVSTQAQKEEATSSEAEEQSEVAESIEIGKVRTALSDTELEKNEGEFPEGVAAEFTYFLYDSVEDMVQAQVYLEKIGVSEEGKKLVVMKKNTGMLQPIYIEVTYYEGDTSYKQTIYFATGKSNFESYLSDDINGTIAFSDEKAYYAESQKIQETVSFGYEELVQYYESLTDYFIIVK